MFMIIFLFIFFSLKKKLKFLQDPIVDNERGIPFEDIQRNPHILLATTQYGGHLAWTEGFIPILSNSWANKVILNFAEAAVAASKQHKRITTGSASTAMVAPATSTTTATAMSSTLWEKKEEKNPVVVDEVVVDEVVMAA